MKTQVSIKLDSEVKKNATKLADDFGLNLSSLINATLKNIVRTQELHLTREYRMTPYLEKLIEQVEKDAQAGKNLSPVFSTGAEMDAYLDSLT